MRVSDWAPRLVRRSSIHRIHDGNPTVLLAAALVVILGLQAWNTGRTQPQGDFWNVRAIGRLTGTTSDIYSDQAQIVLGTALAQQVAAADAGERERRAAAYWPTLNSNNTPAMYAVLGFLQTDDFEFDSAVFEFLSILSILLAIWWMGRRLRYPPVAILVFMAIILGANSAMYLDLWVGNFNAIQVGIVVAYLAMRSRHPDALPGLLAAILLGFAIALKPNLALVAVAILAGLIVERRRRDGLIQVGGLAIGSLVAVAVAFVRFGTLQAWPAWLTTWNGTAFRDYWKMEWGNFSIVRWVWELTGLDMSKVVLIVMVALTAAAFIVGQRRVSAAVRQYGTAITQDHRWGREILLAAAALEITLLASPLTHQHYYLLVTPAMLFLMRGPSRMFGGSGGVVLRQTAVSVAIVLVSVWLVEVLRVSNPSVLYLLSYVFATALLFVVGLRELALDRAVDPLETHVPTVLLPSRIATGW